MAIPRWGPVGAAMITLVTEMFAAAWLVALVLRALRARGVRGGVEALEPLELSADG